MKFKTHAESADFIHIEVDAGPMRPVDSYQAIFNLGLRVLSAGQSGQASWWLICEKLPTYKGLPE